MTAFGLFWSWWETSVKTTFKAPARGVNPTRICDIGFIPELSMIYSVQLLDIGT